MPTKPPAHKPQRTPMPEARPSASARGYDRNWRKFRMSYLSRHPICERCKREQATEIDHRETLSSGGDKYDEGNLMALCKRCHSAKTVACDGGLGRGKQGYERRGVDRTY